MLFREINGWVVERFVRMGRWICTKTWVRAMANACKWKLVTGKCSTNGSCVVDISHAYFFVEQSGLLADVLHQAGEHSEEHTFEQR